MYSWEINRGQNVDTFWCDIPTWVHRPANILEADHIKNESLYEIAHKRLKLISDHGNIELLCIKSIGNDKRGHRF